MRKINKRLIVSDFDGTLLTDDNTVSEEVRAAISEYVSCGGIFAVCTGRMLRSILPRVRELGLTGLVVAYQGTVIAEIDSGKILRSNALSCEDTVEICKKIESLDFCMNTYADEILYSSLPKGDPYLSFYEERTGVEAVSVSKPMSEFVAENKLRCHKVTSLIHPKDRDGLYSALLDEFGDKFDITCSASSLVEVSPAGDNKGEALKYIAAHYGIPISSTVAIGDNLNDLSMIVAAQTGVAVGNAVAGLKDAANEVTVTNNEGAVAKIIEKYGFM